MKTYAEAIAYLYGLQTRGMKFGLRGIRRLLRALDNPHRSLRCIHIAGTNGKGSTASMIAAVLAASGYRTGLYTSPHLVDFAERIRINGTPIPRRDLIRLLKTIRSKIETHRNTFFEAATALAFLYFKERNVDFVVLETGLGGRLDATNVVRPIVSVITSIGLEHTELLGKTLEKIAREKAGIIKRGVPCVAGAITKQALTVIANRCKARNVWLVRSRTENIIVVRDGLDGLVVKAKPFGKKYERLKLGVAGAFQIRNLSIVLNVLRVLVQRGHMRMSLSALRHGLLNVEKLSGLRARLMVIRKKPTIIADVAHNPDGMRALVSSLHRVGIQKARVVFGVMKDKDVGSMIAALASIAENAVLVRASTSRGEDPNVLADCFRHYGIKSMAYASVKRGLREILRNSSRLPILITGSHFVVGEALAALEGKKYLTISQ